LKRSSEGSRKQSAALLGDDHHPLALLERCDCRAEPQRRELSRVQPRVDQAVKLLPEGLAGLEFGGAHHARDHPMVLRSSQLAAQAGGTSYDVVPTVELPPRLLANDIRVRRNAITLGEATPKEDLPAVVRHFDDRDLRWLGLADRGVHGVVGRSACGTSSGTRAIAER
jgi:hypothetical protein